ncbi:methylamine utilization protein [Pseudidiomarina sp. 1APR75-15]|uniref:Methylamine utilization protein n=2 Tax=Pseudidiomarina terrestris TaxID=2820060 RepID=A0ABT8MG63_9GAMM|nr:methylamine utilization protein [Pseudidiomarina sp. 1APR75-15]
MTDTNYKHGVKMRNFQMLGLIFVLAGMISITGEARELQVRVTDSDGAPLPKVVVSSQHSVPQSSSTIAVMDQVERLFAPFILTIQPGATVKFPNSDNIRHQVYSFSPAKPFELPLYSNREAPQITFPAAGVVVLGCNIHDHMRAYIYVSPYPQSVTTDEDGRAVLEVAEDASDIVLWYPGLGAEPTAAQEVTVAAEQQQLMVQLPVLRQQQTPPPVSSLQQRFNRLKDDVN